MDNSIVISGTGFYLPSHQISNEELVDSYNSYVDHYNKTHQQEIAEQVCSALEYSSASFIEKASGIQNRYVVDKKGILDPKRMRPYIPPRPDDAQSIQCEMALQAIYPALDMAQKMPHEVDGLIVSCVLLQRGYPSIAIEIQHALGTQGHAFDMIAGCSSGTFGLSTAYNALKSGQNRCVIVVNPEIPSAQVNYRDRDSHFIFSDACTATVLERKTEAVAGKFEILSIKLNTCFSNNIRNNYGFLNHTERACEESATAHPFFKQQGRKVFKEVVPMVEEHILGHLASLKLHPTEIRRYWLHQANINMNSLIIKKLLNRDPLPLEAPIILDRYGNTTSAGALIAFHEHSSDLSPGDLGVLCSFGAGYSVGSIVVRKL